MSIKTMALLMHIGEQKKPMTIGPPFTENSYDLGAAIKAMSTLMLTMIMLLEW
jgi:hypothetical protein